MKRVRYFPLMAILTILGFALIGCDSKSTNAQNNAEEMSVSTDDTYDETIWNYFKDEDDLTHDVTSYNAMIISKNRQRINSQGNTARMMMSLIYSTAFSIEPSTTVMFRFTDDNKMCRLNEIQSSGILAVFDDGDVDSRWGLIHMDRERRSLLILPTSNQVAPFVDKLKTSKQVRIQVNLENVGRTTFDFDVSGLKWDWDY